MGLAKGLDVGTHMLVCADDKTGQVSYTEQVDAFFSMDAIEEAINILDAQNIPYIEKNGKLFVFGEAARKFANMFKQETRRPMQTGCLNKKDLEALSMLSALLNSIVGKSAGDKAPLCYSVTSKPLGSEMSFEYHKAQIEHILSELGYEPRPIQEARAIALSELADSNFTGIAISCGSGTTTVWLGLMGMDNPNFQFSIDRGGDWIDSNAAENFAGLTRTKVQTVKEKGIKIKDFIAEPNLQGNALLESQAKQALSIYYREYIKSVIKGIKFKLETEQLPEFDGAIPLVIAGGTSMPDDFIDVFKDEWNKSRISLEISEFRKATDPMHAVAKGCLIAAQLIEKKRK